MRKRIKVERSKYGGWGAYLSSGDDDRRGCRLSLRVPGWWVDIRLPAILQPARVWRDLSAKIGHPSYRWLKPNADGRYGYTEVIEREFSLSYGEGYVHVRYGAQTHDSSTDRSWCKELPWMAWRFVRHSLHDLAGTRLCDLSQERGQFSRWEGERALKAAQPTAYYDFDDYDGEAIKARCKIEEREWRRGTGWFRWLSLFWRPKVQRSLDLEFSSEVGARKGSWKGGTLGHGIGIEPGESVESAFRRYCAEHRLAFIGECGPWTREALRAAAQPAAQSTVDEAVRQRVREAVAGAIGEQAFDCTRVWSAWGVGTMTEDDFELIAQNDTRIAEIADAALAAAVQAEARSDG